jgi:nucleotide-binding universal stress UspA family protein
MPELNPFLFGKPVPPGRFVGRQDAIRTLFSRLNQGDSTAIVGEPHIGKSSTLYYVTDEAVRAQFLGMEAARYFVVLVDCHMFSSTSTPADFWRYALSELPLTLQDDGITRHWQEVEASQFSPFKLKRLLDVLARRERRVVLAIDEFDTLLFHPVFKSNAEFFGSLRSMAIQTASLAVITACRLPVTVMNRLSHELNPSGSPFFNNFTEVRLQPLSFDECRTLIEMTLADGDVRFSEDDHTFIHALAGRHPFLVQTAAAGVFEAAVEGKTGARRYQTASKLFHDWSAAHFDDYWRHLAPVEQIALVVLALGELKGRMDRRACTVADLASLEGFGPELIKLHRAGMASQVDSESNGAGVAWSDDSCWQAASRGFVWWVIDNVVAGTRETIGFDSWVREYETHGVLTREQANKLRSLANAIPRASVSSVANVVGLLLTDIPAITSTAKFDVFLSYNRADREAVKEIAEQLKARGISPWLDEWALRPGLPWQQALEKQIRKIKSAAVFVGTKGIGPWQDMEQAAFINEFVKRQSPVIPVILPTSKKVPKLPVFLAGMTWVDFRKDDPDPLERLIFGITGRRGEPRS